MLLKIRNILAILIVTHSIFIQAYPRYIAFDCPSGTIDGKRAVTADYEERGQYYFYNVAYYNRYYDPARKSIGVYRERHPALAKYQLCFESMEPCFYRKGYYLSSGEFDYNPSLYAPGVDSTHYWKHPSGKVLIRTYHAEGCPGNPFLTWPKFPKKI